LRQNQGVPIGGKQGEEENSAIFLKPNEPLKRD
jgi:hypothetical protein